MYFTCMSVGSPGIGIADGCEPPYGTGNWSWVLCKSNTYSELLRHLSSPSYYFLSGFVGKSPASLQMMHLELTSP